MVELQDITGVGESRADDLVEMGYESVEDVAAADPEDLTELSRVGEDRAIEMVVDAENLSGSEESQPDEDTESETITFDEEDLDEEVEELEEEFEVEEPDDEPVEEAVDEERPEEQTFELSFSLDKFESEILTAALIDAYSTLRSRNVSRSEACFRVLEKLRDSTTLQVTEEELNALHSAVRQRRLEYQGNNHVDMMNLTRNIEVQISEARDEYLF